MSTWNDETPSWRAKYFTAREEHEEIKKNSIEETKAMLALLWEKDDEIARLRARIAELESAPTPRVTFDPTRVTSISSGAVVCENMTLMEKKKK